MIMKSAYHWHKRKKIKLEERYNDLYKEYGYWCPYEEKWVARIKIPPRFMRSDHGVESYALKVFYRRRITSAEGKKVIIPSEQPYNSYVSAVTGEGERYDLKPFRYPEEEDSAAS